MENAEIQIDALSIW